MNLYRCIGVRQVYDERCVLDLPDFAIHQGEVLAVVGPSGAGKSTMLRLLNFLEQPSEGRLLFDGHPVAADLPIEQRRRVVTVFQRPVLLRRSVAANLRYGVWLRGDKLSDEEVAIWLRKLGLAHLEHQMAAKLSAGEAQRVALARALLTRPDVLLLDEPTANLDPYNVSLIEQIVTEENQRRAITVVVVTHNIHQARRLADRTGLLLGGKMVEVGDTDKFFTAPERPETTAFIRGDLIY